MDLDRLLGNHSFLITTAYDKQIAATRNGIYFKVTIDNKEMIEINEKIATTIFSRCFVPYHGPTKETLREIYWITSKKPYPKYLVSLEDKLTCYAVDEIENPTFKELLMDEPASYYDRSKFQRHSEKSIKPLEFLKSINQKKYFYIYFPQPKKIEFNSEDFATLMNIIESDWEKSFNSDIARKIEYAQTHTKREIKKIQELQKKKFFGFNDVCLYYWIAENVASKACLNQFTTMKHGITYKNVIKSVERNMDLLKSISYDPTNIRVFRLFWKKGSKHTPYEYFMENKKDK